MQTLSQHQQEILRTSKNVVEHYKDDPSAVAMVEHHKAIITSLEQLQGFQEIEMETSLGRGYTSKSYAKKAAEKQGHTIVRLEQEQGYWFAIVKQTFKKII